MEYDQDSRLIGFKSLQKKSVHMCYWKNKDSKVFSIIRKGWVGRAAGPAGPVSVVYLLCIIYIGRQLFQK